MGVTFPNESLEYRNARNKLLESEVAVRREMEAVATEIRALPRVGPFPRITNSTILTQKGRQQRCDYRNCSGLAPIH